MSQKHPSGQRVLCAAGITLALLGLSAGAAAQEADQQGAESLVVVKDAETGRLRAPTAAEAAALKMQADAAKSMMRAAPQKPLSKVSRSGLRGFRVTDEMMSQSVAVRKPDGGIERQCFDSHGAGADAVAKGHVHSTQAVTE